MLEGFIVGRGGWEGMGDEMGCVDEREFGGDW